MSDPADRPRRARERGSPLPCSCGESPFCLAHDRVVVKSDKQLEEDIRRDFAAMQDAEGEE